MEELEDINFAELHSRIVANNIRFLLVSVDGLPGSGKTKRMEVIQLALSAHPDWELVVVPEPVKEWEESGILEEYYKDIQKWALVFQQEVMRSRVCGLLRIIVREVTRATGPKIIVLLSERTPASDRIFMEMLLDSKQIDSRQFKLYESWCRLWRCMIPRMPVSHIYIDTSVKCSLERVAQRDRKGESIPEDYQTKLAAKHEQFIQSLAPEAALCLDGNIDIELEKEIITKQCYQIIEFVSNRLTRT